MMMKRWWSLLAAAGVFCAVDAAEMKFAIFSDLHVSPGADNVSALEKAVEEVNGNQPDFVIVSGDVSNQGRNEELLEVKRILDGLQVPYYILPGNHETNWSQSAATYFPELWGSERLFFQKDGVTFIGVSTGPYLKMGDGFVRSEDLNWLRDTLKESVQPGEPVVLITHYPINSDLSNWHDIKEILAPYDVKLSICGHWHVMRQIDMNGFHTVICRALLQGDNQGYTLIDWKDDGFTVSEKVLGGEARLLPAGVEETVLNEPVPLTDLATVDGAQIELVAADLSSVFTGVATEGKDFAYGTSSGELKVAAQDNGELVFNESGFEAIYSTPMMASGKVIFGTVKDGIVALNAADGAPAWAVAAEFPVINDGVVVDGDLYMGLGARDFVRVDAASGQEKWRWSGAGGTFQGRPAVSAEAVVFGAWDCYLYALDRQSGKELWRWTNGSTQRLFSPANVMPVIAENKAFIVAPDRHMTAIDMKTGKTIWRDKQYMVRESLGGAPDGKTVYAKTMDGKLIAVPTEANEFATRWVTDLGFGYEHNPCPELVVDGVVYAGSRSGVVAAVDAESGELLYSVKLGNSSVNQFHAAADGAVWLSLIEGKIYRIQPSLPMK